MSRTRTLGTLLLAAAALAGCRTSPWYDLRYAPAPVEVAVAANAVPGSQARVLVSVLGVARAQGAQPERVEVRLRVENLGSVPTRVATDALSLVSADLVAFEAPRVEGAEAAVEPGAAATVDASFPLPAGRGVDGLDWGGLNLRFALEFAGTRVTTGATFTRQVWAVAWGDPYVRFGFGACWD